MHDIPKYPRTPHLPFSPEIHSDDKTITNLSNFIGTHVIITEKIDGSNMCIAPDGTVFARSHQAVATGEIYSWLKNNIANWWKLNNNSNVLFGEYTYGIHSIEYTKMATYFYIFGMLNLNTMMFSEWSFLDELYNYGEDYDYPYGNVKNEALQLVPKVYEGMFGCEKAIKDWMDEEIKKESCIGGEREGFVIRVAEDYLFSDHEKCCAKYVRKGHVQSDEHWSKNWKKANLFKYPPIKVSENILSGSMKFGKE